MNIQILLLVAIPVFLIYTTIIFCYGYKNGFDKGFDIAERIDEMDSNSEREVKE